MSSVKSIFVSVLLLFSMKSFGEPESGCLEGDLSIIHQYQQRNDAEFRGNIESIQCKTHPQHEDIVFASYIRSEHKTERHQNYLWRVLLVDRRTKRSIASYKNVIVEGGDTRIDENSIMLDTARYYLNDEVRALGVRLHTGDKPRCAGFLENDFLTLFVQNGEKLVPVLNNMPTYSWRLVEGDHCNGYEGVIQEKTVHTILHLLNTETNGYRDIRLSDKVEDYTFDPKRGSEERTIRVNQVIKFNGEAYETPSGLFLLNDVSESQSGSTLLDEANEESVGEYQPRVNIDAHGLYLDQIMMNENIIKASTYAYRVVEEKADGHLKVVRFTFLSSTNQECLFNMNIVNHSILLNDVICMNSLYDREKEQFNHYLYQYEYNGLNLKTFDELPSEEMFSSMFNHIDHSFWNVPVMDQYGRYKNMTKKCKIKNEVRESDRATA
ncbi:hypothetical protein L6J37_19340 [Photobacterium sp. WH77]|uniref:hypothetical protein n=1 Tax=unclassified Photobacterium TaxID=2628852 RepID=UPI001EDBFA7B|nr:MULTISPECIES: hypothetical protein [unclassified Photobacterium]MCG2838991.1 hypothetical protein [Photobacterium sp. WH77]MCG2846608.1 hypothetical protein [Photobacterium sp. WH80]